MKADMNDLKKLVLEIMQGDIDVSGKLHKDNAHLISKLYDNETDLPAQSDLVKHNFGDYQKESENIQDTEEIIEESLSLEEKEKELIIKALQKHNGKRKYAAEELGISERTLYRKIKEYDLNEG